VDINGDILVDIADMALVAGSFGDSVPPAPAEHNLAPDPPDQIVDIADMARVAGYFGGQCYGLTITEAIDPLDSVLGVYTCEHRGYAWYKDRIEGYAIIGGSGNGTWYGKTLCAGSGSYSTQCWYGVQSNDPFDNPDQGWILRGITDQSPVVEGLLCGDNAWEQPLVAIPLCEPFRYWVHYKIWHDGALVRNRFLTIHEYWTLC